MTISTLAAAVALCGAGCSREDTVPATAGQAGQGSPGAEDILVRYCGGCHVPPRPESYSADRWPAVVARMQQRRLSRGMAPVPAEELESLIHYLQRRAGE